MNFPCSLARTRFLNGAAKVRIIFESATLWRKIFQKIFRADPGASVLARTHGLVSLPFFKWECKGTTYFQTSKSFFDFPDTEIRPQAPKSLNVTAVRRCYNFVKTRNCISPSDLHGYFLPNGGSCRQVRACQACLHSTHRTLRWSTGTRDRCSSYLYYILPAG